MSVAIHDLRQHVLGGDTGNAYNVSQTSSDIHDGDVLIAEENGEAILAVMVEAWPTAAFLRGNHGEFHSLAEGFDWATLDGGKYVPSIKAINEWRQAHPGVKIG